MLETKFDVQTKTFTGWQIIYEDDANQIIKLFWQYRLVISEDYQRI